MNPVYQASQEQGVLAELEAARAELEAAAEPIRERIADLERDYAPRDKEFWQAVIGLLIDLRPACQNYGHLLQDHIGEHHEMAPLIFPTTMLDHQIDKTAIAITAHLPRCHSFAPSCLWQRHKALGLLQLVDGTVQQIINSTTEIEAQLTTIHQAADQEENL